MPRIKESVVGLRTLSLDWSDRVGKFVAISCVAIIFFLLGLGAGLMTDKRHTRAWVGVHKQPESVASKKAESVVKTESVVVVPIIPRVINAPVLPRNESAAGQVEPANTAAMANAANPAGLADNPQSTVARRSETEERDSVRCLKSAALTLLHAIEDKFGPVKVISTCRPGATIAGSGNPSLHRYGKAIDFVAPDGKRQQIVRWLVETHKTGGVMTYSDSDHIHVDIGPHFVSLAGERRAKSRRRGDDDD